MGKVIWEVTMIFQLEDLMHHFGTRGRARCVPDRVSVILSSQRFHRLHGLRFSPWVGELRLEQDPSHLLSLVVSPAVQPHSRTGVWIWPRNKQ